jgi:hypothetical protein
MKTKDLTLRDHPYRQIAPAVDDDPSPSPRWARPFVALAANALVLVFVVTPVVFLAAQPYSFYATLLVGAAAAWTTVFFFLM